MNDDDILAVPLPRDPTMTVVQTPNETLLLNEMQKAWSGLKALGWNDATYAPRNKDLELIEVGSTGIHKGYRDGFGFWVCDGDVWPSSPCLWRLNMRKETPPEIPVRSNP